MTRPDHGTRKARRPSSVWGITTAVSAGSTSPRSTRCAPLLGRMRNGGAPSIAATRSAHTPVAFTTWRARTSSVRPVSRSSTRGPERRGDGHTERPGQSLIQGDEKWLRPDQMRGEPQEARAFAERLADELQLPAGQIPDAAVDQFGGAAASPAGEVGLLDEPDA